MVEEGKWNADGADDADWRGSEKRNHRYAQMHTDKRVGGKWRGNGRGRGNGSGE
jgi:hypothetical protein